MHPRFLALRSSTRKKGECIAISLSYHEELKSLATGCLHLTGKRLVNKQSSLDTFSTRGVPRTLLVKVV